MNDKTIQLTINGNSVAVPAGTTILEAARSIGVAIPTLCHIEKMPAYTSCMICMVWDATSDAMRPSCSARVEEGMVIRTDTQAVHAARRATLELLLSEHQGDCEAPCRMACPAYMDIPLMIRHIGAGNLQQAAAVVKAHIPLPAILGRICPAPCEKACRRAAVDGAVAICLLKRRVGDADLGAEASPLPPCEPATGRRVAVVGAGPAGLSAAWFLRRAGHECVVMEKEEHAGGTLRTAIPRAVLPADILDSELARIQGPGIAWRTGVALDTERSLAELRSGYDAVILALGASSAETLQALNLPTGPSGIVADPRTFAVDGLDGVFAVGACVRPTRMAVRSVADGNEAAGAVSTWLGHVPAARLARRFNSRMPKLSEDELRECRKEGAMIERQAADPNRGFTQDAARREASRCLRCDCRDKTDCGLRALSEEYEARQRRYSAGGVRPGFSKRIYADGTILETGKCIKCGKCVRICANAGAARGFAFLGRGLEVTVGVPFGGDLSDVPERIVRACIAACPTGALAHEDEGTVKSYT